MEVSKRMATGKSLDAIAGKQIVVLDTGMIFAVHSEKQDLEPTLIKMFDEALVARNTIIVIENISNFIREAEALGFYSRTT